MQKKGIDIFFSIVALNMYYDDGFGCKILSSDVSNGWDVNMMSVLERPLKLHGPSVLVGRAISVSAL